MGAQLGMVWHRDSGPDRLGEATGTSNHCFVTQAAFLTRASPRPFASPAAQASSRASANLLLALLILKQS